MNYSLSLSCTREENSDTHDTLKIDRLINKWLNMAPVRNSHSYPSLNYTLWLARREAESCFRDFSTVGLVITTTGTNSVEPADHKKSINIFLALSPDSVHRSRPECPCLTMAVSSDSLPLPLSLSLWFLPSLFLFFPCSVLFAGWRL